MRFSPFDFDVITTPELPTTKRIPGETVPDRSDQADVSRQDESGSERRDNIADKTVGGIRRGT